MELNIKEERAAKAIAELQDRLIESRRDRKDMEIEFIALKKNYYQVKQELDQEKLKSENINIELINLVNENNALQREMQMDQKLKGEVSQTRQYMEIKNERLEKELQDARQSLLDKQAEINSLNIHFK